MNKAIKDANESKGSNAEATEEDLNKISKAFDNLYAVLRMTEAAEIDKKIQEKYKYLREIKADAITHNSITLVTKKSLERELGTSNIPDPDVEDEDDDTPAVSDSDDEDSEEVDDDDEEDGDVEESSGSKKQEKLTAKQLADEVYRMISGPSDELDYPTVDLYISSKHLNKDNIIEFLGAFYAHGSHEGIIEYLDDEHDDGLITMKNKKNIIESLIAKAKKRRIW